MKLDDNTLTAMVDAAAKGHYVRALNPEVAQRMSVTVPEWDELPPLEKNRWREAVMMVVWDAVAAMPDPRYAAWSEGYIAADNGLNESTNPYPTLQA